MYAGAPGWRHVGAVGCGAVDPKTPGGELVILLFNYHLSFFQVFFFQDFLNGSKRRGEVKGSG